MTPSSQSDTRAVVRTKVIYARVSADLHEAVKRSAEERGMTLSGRVNEILRAGVGEPWLAAATPIEARYRMALEAILSVGQLDAHAIAREALSDA